LIPQGLSAKLRRTTAEGLLNLKDLLKVFPSSSRVTFLRFVGRPKRDDGNLLIQRWLSANRVGRPSKGLLNLKDLLKVFPSSGRVTSSGFVARRKRGEAYLLIPRWLLAKFLNRTGEGLLNLKDLLTVPPASPKALLESAPGFKALFLCRIAPNLASFQQKRADIGRKWGLYEMIPANSYGRADGNDRRKKLLPFPVR